MDTFYVKAAKCVVAGLPVVGTSYSILDVIASIGEGSLTAPDSVLAAVGLIPHLGAITNAGMLIGYLSVSGACHHNYKTYYNLVVSNVRG